MIQPIRLYGDPVLRRVAAPVRRFDADLRALARDLLDTVHDANGVGLAAPQIGVPQRVFVALEMEDRPADEEPEARDPGHQVDADANDANEANEAHEDRSVMKAEHLMVNPEIVARDGVRVAPDGCLSLPGLWTDEMTRDRVIRVRYQDLDGTVHEREASDHFAHVIQHELDHLDGILFFDRMDEDTKRAFLERHRRELAEFQRQAKAVLRDLRRAAS